MQKFQIKQYNFMNNMNNWISSKTSSTFNSMTSYTVNPTMTIYSPSKSNPFYDNKIGIMK